MPTDHDDRKTLRKTSKVQIRVNCNAIVQSMDYCHYFDLACVRCIDSVPFDNFYIIS